MHAPHKEGVGMPPPLTDIDLDEIEAEAKTNAAETYRGALLALVGDVRRLRAVVLGKLDGKP